MPRYDEHGLTPKKKMFADEYCKCGNLYRSYCATHTVNEGTKKGTVEHQAGRLVREPAVEAYIKKKQEAIAAKCDIDTQFVIKSLIKVVEQNAGKHTSVRALELLGKINGYFWEKPARKFEGDIELTNNSKAAEQVLQMMKDGLITEESANAWIHSLKQKSDIEEKENTNKEILEKLDTLNNSLDKRTDE